VGGQEEGWKLDAADLALLKIRTLTRDEIRRKEIRMQRRGRGRRRWTIGSESKDLIEAGSDGKMSRSSGRSVGESTGCFLAFEGIVEGVYAHGANPNSETVQERGVIHDRTLVE
jgi:hypothetical protein